MKDPVFEKYDFRWEVLDVVIGGKSIIDTNQGLSNYGLKTIDDADRFLKSYGFDLDDPIEKAEAFGNVHEAVNFIRKYFLAPENPEGLKLEMPRKILELTEIRDLLLMAGTPSVPGASEPPQGGLKHWACAVLKVVHALAHIDKDVRTPYFTDIQKQIFDRFYKVIHRDEAGQLYLGEKPDDLFRVDLLAFETKPKKSRESILLKMLHKPEAVADEIFDRVGIRFVTKSVLDTLRVVKYLKDSLIVMPANIKPTRSRNTLIDLKTFKADHAEIMKDYRAGSMSPERLGAALQERVAPQKAENDNPHTSKFYRSIQFTLRQLIHFTNPVYDDLKELKNQARLPGMPENWAKKLEAMDLKYVQREVRFFYPYEVQIMDQQSHEENERGRSAHSEYKKAQVRAALQRVMGVLAGPLNGQTLSTQSDASSDSSPSAATDSPHKNTTED